MQDVTAMQTPGPPSVAPRLREVVVVANGRAGALVADPQAEAALEAAFQSAGLNARFVPQDAGSLPERLAIARGMAADAVVVAGGDGTVACAARELLDTGIALGILPFGTMNLLAKDLGIPVGDTPSAIKLLADGVGTDIDVGCVGDQVFLCASMLGLPARLARLREDGRGKGRLRSWSRFALAAWRALTRGRRLVLGLHTDSGVERVAAQSVTVTVNTLDPRADHAFGRARLDGGVLGVYVVARVRVWDLPRLTWNALMGHLPDDAAVRELRMRRLSISASGRTMRVMNDGEVRLLRPPLRYHLRPKALRVIAPPREPSA